MTPIPITLTATFPCPVCKEVVTVEKPELRIRQKEKPEDLFIGFERYISAFVTCPHCGEEYEGEA